jgi:hypothetical protein
MASINVDGLVYGEAMIRALEIDVRDLRAALKLAEEERDTWRGKYEHCLETLHANDRQTVLAQRHLTTERDAAVRERDGLHTSLKAVADLCIDKAGLRAMEVVGEDSPPRAVAKIIEQRDAAIARAEQAEIDRDAIESRIVALIEAALVDAVEVPAWASHETARIVNAVRIQARMVGSRSDEAERIAKWLETYIDLYPTQRKVLIENIRNHAYRKGDQ